MRIEVICYATIADEYEVEIDGRSFIVGINNLDCDARVRTKDTNAVVESFTPEEENEIAHACIDYYEGIFGRGEDDEQPWCEVCGADDAEDTPNGLHCLSCGAQQ